MLNSHVLLKIPQNTDLDAIKQIKEITLTQAIKVLGKERLTRSYLQQHRIKYE